MACSSYVATFGTPQPLSPMKTSIPVLLFSLVFVPAVDATTLDFDLGLLSGEPIPADYGDRTGSTPHVVVSYRELDGFGGGATTLFDNLTHWNDGYGDLNQVGWGHSLVVGGNDPSHVAEISFVADAGATVVLESFDLGGWSSDRASRSVRIYDEDYNLLIGYGPMTILGGAAHSSFAPDVEAGILYLQWDYPYYVGIDNIVFEQRGGDVVGVPETAFSLTLLLTTGILLVVSRTIFRSRERGVRGGRCLS